MDVLSEALRGFRFSGAIFIEAELTGPWAVVTPSAMDITAVLSLGADHVIPYHLVTAGECTVTLRGREPVLLTSGDIALFPHGDVHTLASQGGIPPTVLSRDFVGNVLKRRSVLPIRHGGGGGRHKCCADFL